MYTWTELDPDDRAEVLRLLRELVGRHANRPGGRLVARSILAAVWLLEQESRIAELTDQVLATG